MAFPTTSTLDAFDRANEDPLANGTWGGISYNNGDKFKISSNTCVPETSTLYNTQYWNTSFNADQEAFITINTKGSVDGDAIWFDMRIQNVGTTSMSGYEIAFSNSLAGTDTITVYRIDNMGFTALGAAISQEITVGDSVGVSIIGSLITVWYKAGAGSWINIGMRTDSTYGAGYIGIGASGHAVPAIVLDTFGGGNALKGILTTRSNYWGNAY